MLCKAWLPSGVPLESGPSKLAWHSIGAGLLLIAVYAIDLLWY